MATQVVYPVSTNPGRYDLAALFGNQNALNRTAAQGSANMFGQPLQQAISQYLQPTSFGQGGPGILSSILGSPTDYLNQYQASLGNLQQAVNTAAQFNATGMPTDATPIYNEAIRQYNTYALPAAAETAGLGVQSSGFGGLASQAAQNLLGEAALQNVNLQEAAKQRQMQAAPLLQGLTAAQAQYPINLASDLTGLFNYEQRKPIDLFGSLYAAGSGGTFAAPSYSPTSGAGSNAALIGGLSGLAGQIAQTPIGQQGLSYLGSGIGSAFSGLGSLFGLGSSGAAAAAPALTAGLESGISAGIGAIA